MTWQQFFSRTGAGLRGMCVGTGHGLARAWRSPAFARRLALLLVIGGVGWFLYAAIVRVREGEVGVVVNNLSGKLDVEEAVGIRFVVPIAESFFRLDRRVQTLVMSEAGGSGFRGGDAIKFKTKDGADVAVDVAVNYHLLATQAAAALRDAGRMLSASQPPPSGELWVRSAVRAMVAREFGRLTTEEMYGATRRDEEKKEGAPPKPEEGAVKPPSRDEIASNTVQLLNRELAAHHIDILSLTIQEVRFFKEYQEVIAKKKLTDQEVVEQLSQLNLANTDRELRSAEADKKAKETTKRAEGEGNKIKKAADGYELQTKLDADAAFIKADKAAQGYREVGFAEAKGLKAAVDAVSGTGGVQLVALEYAKKLSTIVFSGVPIIQEGVVPNFRLHNVNPDAQPVFGPQPPVTSPASPASPPPRPNPNAGGH